MGFFEVTVLLILVEIKYYFNRSIKKNMLNHKTIFIDTFGVFVILIFVFVLILALAEFGPGLYYPQGG
jgi:hypothetical protein